jgi:hypothetical protein
MRTAPVALTYLDDEAALVQAARAVCELTHYDPEAGDVVPDAWPNTDRRKVIGAVSALRGRTRPLDARGFIRGLRGVQIEPFVCVGL